MMVERVTNEMERHGMGRNGMGWDGMGRYRTGWDRMGWDAMVERTACIGRKSILLIERWHGLSTYIN